MSFLLRVEDGKRLVIEYILLLLIIMQSEYFKEHYEKYMQTHYAEEEQD